MKGFLSWLPDKTILSELQEKLDQFYQQKKEHLQELESEEEQLDEAERVQAWYQKNLEKLEYSRIVDRHHSDMQANYFRTIAQIDCDSSIEDESKLEMMISCGVLLQTNFRSIGLADDKLMEVIANCGKMDLDTCKAYSKFLFIPSVADKILERASKLDEQAKASSRGTNQNDEIQFSGEDKQSFVKKKK